MDHSDAQTLLRITPVRGLNLSRDNSNPDDSSVLPPAGGVESQYPISVNVDELRITPARGLNRSVKAVLPASAGFSIFLIYEYYLSSSIIRLAP